MIRIPCAALAAAVVLCSCGGGSGTDNSAPVAAGNSAAAMLAQPDFHLAPLRVAPPSSIDADGAGRSATLAPHTLTLPGALAQLATQGMTPGRIAAQTARSTEGPVGVQQTPSAAPPGVPAVIYTPAQIRAAYLLPALPQAGSALGAGEAASLGAGQTIYLIEAHASPNLFLDLETFDDAFGLPPCAWLPVAAASALPLAPAAGGCSLSVVALDSAGARTDAAPDYDEAWAVETSMDVQWAHATAPLARLIVIAASSADVRQLAAAVRTAAAIGPGVVSMSFGAPEGNYVRALQSVFEMRAGMSYVASAGDAGSGAAWPATSPAVLAVGGTTLRYAGGASRQESAWRSTGGGWSAYFAEPAWQAAIVQPSGRPPKSKRHRVAQWRPARGVTDVAFNADPLTGQFIVFTAPDSNGAGWFSGGGTSIGAPQWAGLLAIAEAQRALAGKDRLGPVQATLYQRIATVAGLYAGAFYDVRTGGDTYFAAHAGYDLPTGLGTPNGTDLLALLAAQ